VYFYTQLIIGEERKARGYGKYVQFFPDQLRLLQLWGLRAAFVEQKARARQ
jgi:hypothetical protein